MTRILLIGGCLLLAAGPAAAAQPNEVVRLDFTATGPAAPDTAVTVTVTSPAGGVTKVPGFWAGGTRFGCNVRPDRPGEFAYTVATVPPVPGVNGAAGRLAVSPARTPPTNPLLTHGPVRVAPSKTYLEHADGTPFFFLADTCWTGPAFGTAADWQVYLKDRAAKRFSAVQFNMASPWRVAPADADGHPSYTLAGGKLTIDPAFYARVEARMRETLDAGLLPVPVLCWAHKAGDAGVDLTETQVTQLVNYELDRFAAFPAVWILAGDSQYTKDSAARWKRIGRAVFENRPGLVVTTHPTGTNWPWADWAGETWLTALGYQSGHGDGPKSWDWVTAGPPAKYGRQATPDRPAINLEPPYEAHKAYQSGVPHSAYNVRRAVYWSLLVGPPAGVTYGGHGVWSWHTRAGYGPTDHESTGVAPVWRDGLKLPGAAQMKVVRDVFESVPWPELRPAPELLKARPGAADPAKFIAAAATPARDAFVIYIPGGQLGLDQLAEAVEGPDGQRVLTVVDPATGRKVESTLAKMLVGLAATGGLDGKADGDLLVVYNGRAEAGPKGKGKK